MANTGSRTQSRDREDEESTAAAAGQGLPKVVEQSRLRTIQKQSARTRRLEEYMKQVHPADMETNAALMTSIRNTMQEKIHEDSFPALALGLGTFANEVYNSKTNNPVPEYEDNGLGTLLQAHGLSSEQVETFLTALDEPDNVHAIRQALQESDGLSSVIGSHMRRIHPREDEFDFIVKDTVSASVSVKETVDVFKGVSKCVVPLDDSDEFNTTYMWKKKKQLCTILMKGKVHVPGARTATGAEKFLVYDNATAIKITNLIFNYFDYPGTYQLANIIKDLNAKSGTSIQLMANARVQAATYRKSFPELADVFETFPGDLGSINTDSPSHEFNLVVNAGSHGRALRGLYKIQASREQPIRQELARIGIANANTIGYFAMLSALLYKCLGDRGWTEEGCVFHVRIAMFYFNMFETSDGMALMQPPGTHKKLIKLDISQVEGAFSTLRRICPRILQQIDIVGGWVFDEARQLGTNPDARALTIDKLAISKAGTSGRYRSLTDIMNTVQGIYGASQRPTRIAEDEMSDYDEHEDEAEKEQMRKEQAAQRDAEEEEDEEEEEEEEDDDDDDEMELDWE